MKKIVFIALAVATIAACAKSENFEVETTKSLEMKFTSNIATRVSGNEWEVGDMIGISTFLNSADGSSRYPLDENVSYVALNGGATTSFSVAEHFKPLYFPEKESFSCSLLAYYPFNYGVDSNGLFFNIVDQSNLGRVDYMEATANLTESNIGEPIDLQFEHKHTLLRFNISTTDYIQNPDNITLVVQDVKIMGIAGSTSWDRDDLNNSFGSISNTPLRDGADENHKRMEMILFPTESDAPVALTLLFHAEKGSEYKATLNTTLAAGKQQSYNIELGLDRVVISGGEIEPWVDAVEENDEITPNLE